LLHARFINDFGRGVMTLPHVCNRGSEGKTLTPIINAVEEGDIELVRLLISAGADVNAVGS
jgi:hypothetical protein